MLQVFQGLCIFATLDHVMIHIGRVFCLFCVYNSLTERIGTSIINLRKDNLRKDAV